MTSSISCSSKLLALLLGGILLCAGCAGTGGGRPPAGSGNEFRSLLIAVLPIDNLSQTAAPRDEIRTLLRERLVAAGFRVLSEEELNDFMTRHRLRYTGGLDAETARAFQVELGVEAVLITSLELYLATPPPKISLLARLVATGETPEILWMDHDSRAGDDTQGLLGLGRIDDPRRLVEVSVSQLVASLAAAPVVASTGGLWNRRFAPRLAYGGALARGEGPVTVVVLPFINRSTRRYAAELMALHFVEQLAATPQVRVVEPGLIRDKLLAMRIIMEDGVTLPMVRQLTDALDVDYLLCGTVFDYQDFEGEAGTPKVDFSAQLIARENRRTVWASNSRNRGNDGVFFYDWGNLSTAGQMAARMSAAVVGRWTFSSAPGAGNDHQP